MLVCRWRCSGSAAAHSLSQIYNCLFLYAFIRWKKLHVATWGGEATFVSFEFFFFLFLQTPSFPRHGISWFLSPPAGWSVESLQEWGAYMKLALPSMFMICFEWWVYEFGGFFAGVYTR